MMRAVEIIAPGGPERLRLTRRPIPRIGDDEVLLRVAAAGVNRPDASQRRGIYPPPPGITDIPGLEVAGTVVEVGRNVRERPATTLAAGVPALHPGDAVCALVPGGGYAEYVAAPAGSCLPLPDGYDLRRAAVLPEACFTAWIKLFEVGHLSAGETVLIHGGAGGVGLAAIQFAARIAGARVLATAGTSAKRAVCIEHGASQAFDYHDTDWPRQVFDATNSRGVDLVLDPQGGDYVRRELAILGTDGRLVLIGAHGGTEASFDVRDLIRRRLSIHGSVVRSRSTEAKRATAGALLANVWPGLASGAIRLPIQHTFGLEAAQAAHEILERNAQCGKLVLSTDQQQSRGDNLGDP